MKVRERGNDSGLTSQDDRSPISSFSHSLFFKKLFLLQVISSVYSHAFVNLCSPCLSIKREATQLRAAIDQISSGFRLMLTGTPIQARWIGVESILAAKTSGLFENYHSFSTHAHPSGRLSVILLQCFEEKIMKNIVSTHIFPTFLVAFHPTLGLRTICASSGRFCTICCRPSSSTPTRSRTRPTFARALCK
jgi:hypothetical protein